MLKNVYFFGKKTVKAVSTRGLRPRIPVCLRRLEAEPSDSRVVTPAYNYNSV